MQRQKRRDYRADLIRNTEPTHPALRAFLGLKGDPKPAPAANIFGHRFPFTGSDVDPAAVAQAMEQRQTDLELDKTKKLSQSVGD